jgi:hypothetical protein
LESAAPRGHCCPERPSDAVDPDRSAYDLFAIDGALMLQVQA